MLRPPPARVVKSSTAGTSRVVRTSVKLPLTTPCKLTRASVVVSDELLDAGEALIFSAACTTELLIALIKRWAI